MRFTTGERAKGNAFVYDPLGHILKGDTLSLDPTSQGKLHGGLHTLKGLQENLHQDNLYQAH